MNRKTKATVALVAALVVGWSGLSSIGGGTIAHGVGGDLATKSDAEVITILDQGCAAGDLELLSAAFKELNNREGRVDRPLLAQFVADASHTLEARQLAIDLLAGEQALRPLDAVARDLLFDSNLEPELKARIFVDFDFTKQDVDLLVKFAKQGDIVGFQALKKLTKIDAVQANELAKNFLGNSTQVSDDQISAALKARARSGLLAKDEAAKKAFIKETIALLQTKSASQKVQDAALFALGDLRDKDAISALMASDFQDKSLLGGVIDQNWDVLISMLSGKPSERDI